MVRAVPWNIQAGQYLHEGEVCQHVAHERALGLVVQCHVLASTCTPWRVGEEGGLGRLEVGRAVVVHQKRTCPTREIVGWCVWI